MQEHTHRKRCAAAGRLLLLTILMAACLHTSVLAAAKSITLQIGSYTHSCVLSETELAAIMARDTARLSGFLAEVQAGLVPHGLDLDEERLLSELSGRIQSGYFGNEVIDITSYCMPIPLPVVIPPESLSDNEAVPEEAQEEAPEEPSMLDTLAAQGYSQLSGFSTKYNHKTARGGNINIGASHINGTLLQPGEEFSTDAAIGRRTSANGFKEATVFVGGEKSKGIGGGICQISSTLYNAILKAGIVPSERRNHSLRVDYVGIGLDATLSSGAIDLKFTNPYPHPIYIEAVTADGVLTVNIYGMASDLQGQTFDTHVDVKSSKKASTYLVTYVDGQEVKRTYLNTSVYK